MTFTKSATGIESDDGALLQYESLRSRVLNKHKNLSGPGLGLALFIRRGMLAWVDLCQRCIASEPSAKKQMQTHALVCGATSEMIKVMANITLCNLEEALS